MIVVSLMSGLFNSKFRRVNFLRTFYGDLHSLLLGFGPGIRADQPRGIDVSFLGIASRSLLKRIGTNYYTPK